MSIHAAPRILIVAGLCAAALIGLVVAEGMARDNGQEVLLAIEAVDPRSLLSGHYVVVNPTRILGADEPCPPGQETRKWVALAPDGEAYRVSGGARAREQAQLMGALAVRGSFECIAPREDGPGWVRIDLGVSRFHASQTEATRIERVLREQRPGEPVRAYAIVSVGRDGRARLKGLMIGGERLELRWL